ncbi:MAG: ABC transporter ATP-binding protein [Alphaproteobacteria bacterium]|nr:ABC transporter ATP-binding protein [Alphaproteobacteria bacterium]
MSDILAVDGLTVRFGGLTAVDSVSLKVPEREIHGLIGPNGAGKTTFFNAVSGLVTPSGGSIGFLGRTITTMPPYARAALGIRRTFQSLQLIPRLTVLENVLMGLHTEIRTNPWASLFTLRGRDKGEKEAQARVLATLDYLGIGATILSQTGTLTFAQQRYVEIARAIVSSPPFLMLDEPAAGLSPNEVRDLDRLLRRLRDERGITILLVEHVISLVLGVCEQVSVLDNGRLIAEGTPEQVANDPKVKAAYLGEDSGADGH